MTFFDDAAAFMRQKQNEHAQQDHIPPLQDSSFLSNGEFVKNRSIYIELLKKEYENATLSEIEHALDKISEQDNIPRDFKQLLKKIRVYLED